MFIFLDTETTGTGPGDRLCQIAFKTGDGRVVNELFNPGMPISIDAMSIHHITNEMVQDKPPFLNSRTWSRLQELLDIDDNVMVAHNASFDVGMLKREHLNPKNIVCTLKLAHYLDEEGAIPRFSLQYLRYYLNLNVDATPHDALGDMLVLEALFKRIYTKIVDNFGDDSTQKMIEISNKPILYRRMPYGKHRGLKMDIVPVDYLQWLSTTDLDENMRYTVEHYLKS